MKKWLFLLRAFFPSWNFFSDVGPDPLLSFRYGKDLEGWTVWSPVIDSIPRRFTNLFFNPVGNLLHAQRNALQHFLLDLESESRDVESKTTYCIVKNMVEVKTRESLAKQFGEGPLLRSEKPEVPNKSWNYQFKIEILDQVSVNVGAETILLSPVYFLDDGFPWK